MFFSTPTCREMLDKLEDKAAVLEGSPQAGGMGLQQPHEVQQRQTQSQQVGGTDCSPNREGCTGVQNPVWGSVGQGKHCHRGGVSPVGATKMGGMLGESACDVQERLRTGFLQP